MITLSDLPDDILSLISIRLNGLDNYSLWMASDSSLRKRVLSNIMIDFEIGYTISGRYMWPGNFLKRLEQLSRLSLVIDQDTLYIPLLHQKESYLISTLKYLRLDLTNCHLIFDLNHIVATASQTSSPNKYTNLNDYYINLEHLEIITSGLQPVLSTDFLRCLPQNLQTLLIPGNYFNLDSPNSSNDLNTHIRILPRTLTSLNIHFYYSTSNKPCLDLSNLPPNLTNLTTNLLLDDQTYDMIPKSLKSLVLEINSYNIEKLSPFLPTGLENLSIMLDESPAPHQMFSHLRNLESITFPKWHETNLDSLITNSPPKLKNFCCDLLDLTALPVENKLFSNCLTRLQLHRVIGLSSGFISSLPQSLTYLEIFLGSAQNPFAFFSLLPRTLKSIDTDLNILENISLLPESLTYLSLANNSPCDASYFDRLPSKLKTFKVEQKLPLSIMKLLPESLTELHVFCDDVVDDEIVRMLPRGLKEFSLSTLDNITDATVTDLPPSLKKLVLLYNTAMTDNAIRLLPRSLTHLNLKKNPNFTSGCINHLPPKLIALYRNGIKRKTFNSYKDQTGYLELWITVKNQSLPEMKNWGFGQYDYKI